MNRTAVVFGWLGALAGLKLAIDLARAVRARGRVSARPAPVSIVVAIICGDCAGDGLLPRQTMLSRDGSCRTCGGRSYVLASDRPGALRRPVAWQRDLAVSAKLDELDADPLAEYLSGR